MSLVSRAPVTPGAPLRVVCFASGSGTTMQALLDGAQQPGAGYVVSAAVINKKRAGAIDRAERAAVAVHVISHRAYDSREAFERAILDALAAAPYDIVALCGFMRVLTETFLSGCGVPVLNVHPSLLPLYPGTDGPAQAIAAGATESGCTVHVVDAGVDTGPVLAQRKVPVMGDDDAVSLHQRIQAQERTLYVDVLNAIARAEV